MSEKKTIFVQKLVQKGFFNYSDTYNFCYLWIKDEGYDLTEKKYKEKITQRGKLIEIEWIAEKEISDYFKIVIEVKWRIVAMTDVEVEENGKKIKTNKGELEMKFKGKLERDYEDRWEKTPLYKWMRGIYDRYIIRTIMDQYEEDVFSDAQEWVEQIKSFLRLEGRR